MPRRSASSPWTTCAFCLAERGLSVLFVLRVSGEVCIEQGWDVREICIAFELCWWASGAAGGRVTDWMLLVVLHDGQ